jgi:hypothetical protein
VDEERTYPCIKCDKLRTKSEGGTTFSVCKKCWDKENPKVEVNNWDKIVSSFEDFYHPQKITLEQLELINWLKSNYSLTKL